MCGLEYGLEGILGLEFETQSESLKILRETWNFLSLSLSLSLDGAREKESVVCEINLPSRAHFSMCPVSKREMEVGKHALRPLKKKIRESLKKRLIPTNESGLSIIRGRA